MKLKSQICTSVEESKRLLELGLKKETADCALFRRSKNAEWEISPVPYMKWVTEILTIVDSYTLEDIIPAWSLHRLMEIAYKGDILGCVELNFHERNIGAYYEQVITVIEYLIGVNEFNKDYLEERK